MSCVLRTRVNFLHHLSHILPEQPFAALVSCFTGSHSFVEKLLSTGKGPSPMTDIMLSRMFHMFFCSPFDPTSTSECSNKFTNFSPKCDTTKPCRLFLGGCIARILSPSARKSSGKNQASAKLWCYLRTLSIECEVVLRVEERLVLLTAVAKKRPGEGCRALQAAKLHLVGVSFRHRVVAAECVVEGKRFRCSGEREVVLWQLNGGRALARRRHLDEQGGSW